MPKELISLIFSKLPNLKLNSHQQSIVNLHSQDIIDYVKQFYIKYQAAESKLAKELQGHRFDFLRNRAARKGEKELDKMLQDFLVNLVSAIGGSELSVLQQALLCFACVSNEPASLIHLIDHKSHPILDLITNNLNWLGAGRLEDCDCFLTIILNEPSVDRLTLLYFVKNLLQDSLLAAEEMFPKIQRIYQALFDRYLMVDGNLSCRSIKEFDLWLDIAVTLFKLQPNAARLETISEIKSMLERMDPKIAHLHIVEVYKRISSLVEQYGAQTVRCNWAQLKNPQTLESIESASDEILQADFLNLLPGQTIVCKEQKVAASDKDITIYEFSSAHAAQLYSLYLVVCKPAEVVSWYKAPVRLELKDDSARVCIEIPPLVEKQSFFAQFKGFARQYGLQIIATTAVVGGTIYAAKKRDLMPKMY